MASALPRPWTVDEFLEWEREQAERYELVDGVVRMMTGGTLAHTIVKGNIFAALRGLVKASPEAYRASRYLRHDCRVLVGGAKVVTASASLYPDVLVTCAPVVVTDDSVHEPRLIAEVLSRSTADHDRSTKWLSGCPGERILRQASNLPGAYRSVDLHEATPCSPTSVGSARLAHSHGSGPSSSTLTLTTLGQQLPSLAHYLLVWQDRAQVELFSRQDGGGWELTIVEAPALLRLEALAIELDIGQLHEGLEL